MNVLLDTAAFRWITAPPAQLCAVTEAVLGDARDSALIVGGVLIAAAVAVNARASARICSCGDAVYTKTGLMLTLGGVAALIGAARTPKVVPGTRLRVSPLLCHRGPSGKSVYSAGSAH